MQGFNGCKGELCFEMLVTTLLWAYLWKWSSKQKPYVIHFQNNTLCSEFKCLFFFIYWMLLSAGRRGERLHEEFGVQVLYAQVRLLILWFVVVKKLLFSKYWWYQLEDYFL